MDEVMAKRHENLRPLNTRTKNEQREIASAGGMASGQKRREQRTIRNALKVYLSMQNEGDVEGDNLLAMCVAQVEKAKLGDTSAFVTIRDSIGEKPKEKLEHSGNFNAEVQIYRIPDNGRD